MIPRIALANFAHCTIRQINSPAKSPSFELYLGLPSQQQV